MKNWPWLNSKFDLPLLLKGWQIFWLLPYERNLKFGPEYLLELWYLNCLPSDTSMIGIYLGENWQKKVTGTESAPLFYHYLICIFKFKLTGYFHFSNVNNHFHFLGKGSALLPLHLDKKSQKVELQKTNRRIVKMTKKWWLNWTL